MTAKKPADSAVPPQELPWEPRQASYLAQPDQDWVQSQVEYLVRLPVEILATNSIGRAAPNAE
jgi:hypothetical protein